MKNSRRDFLKKGALAGFSALMIPEIAKAAVKENTSCLLYTSPSPRD